MDVDQVKLELLREMVMGADYLVASGEYPSFDKPIFGSVIAPCTISPKPREVVIYSSEFARRVILRPSDSIVADYSYWITKTGLYIPFTAYVSGHAFGTIKDSSYFHLYSRFGHEEIDRKWTGGVGHYDEDFEEYRRQEKAHELNILRAVVAGTFKG